MHAGVCPWFGAHPLRRYFDAGLLVTLNSDDPAFFGSEVANEYLLAYTEHGFTRDELRQLAANSFRRQFSSACNAAFMVQQNCGNKLKPVPLWDASNVSCSATTRTGDASKESWAMIDIGDQSSLCMQKPAI